MPDFSDLAYSMAGVKPSNRFDVRRKFATQLLQSGTDTSPILHPLQGVGRLAQALAGGWIANQADSEEKDLETKRSGALAAAMAEPDPQKRIGLLSAVNPELGARLSGQLAIEQAKITQEQEGRRTAAGNFGASYGLPQGAPPQAGVPPLPQGTPAPGGFNNNVGNIRATNLPWDGKGPPQNGFETFNTPQAGANAAFKNLGAYVQANPNMSVADAIKKWAPPNENNTQQYIAQVAEGTGINPGMPLAEVLKDPAVAAQLLDAITRKEKGGLPQGVNADTFMNATTPGGQGGQPGPLTINMGGPGIPQGDSVPPGMPPQPSPQGVVGPTLQAPPIPEVPRPQPTPQQIQQYQSRLATGEFGAGPEASSRARAALEAELDRDWGVRRETAKMQYSQQSHDYNEQQKQQNERDNPKYTEDANKTHGYALRIAKALPQLEAMAAAPGGFPSRLDRAVTNLPVLGNTLAGPQGQHFDQLTRNVINSILRRESGATITPAEFDNAYKQYIPQPGDDPENVKLKLDNLRTQLRAFADTANRPPETYGLAGTRGATALPYGRAEAQPPTPQAAAPQPGTIMQGYRFKGGNPADQSSWERAQ